jgi:hypothetical protein
MRLSELNQLIRLQHPSDPDPVVSLDVDTGRHPLSGQEMRQPRRIMDARLSPDGKAIILEADGVLLSEEAELLDNGLYNRSYDEYEAHWNRLPVTAHRYVLGVAEVAEAGLSIRKYEDQRWDELPLRIQQMIIVRVNIPVRNGVNYETALIEKGVKQGSVVEMGPRR